MDVLPNEDILEGVRRKATFKQKVYRNTIDRFKLLKSVLDELAGEYNKRYASDEIKIPFIFRNKSEFEVELEFGGDILVFMMHTNVFEFSRNHEVMNTRYVRENTDRSYCGVFMIFNFLADSFRYNRQNDIGYMIGRVFVNLENHYFIEGKKEVGQLYNNFETGILDKQTLRTLVESALRYTINFDLLSPPFDQVKEVALMDIQASITYSQLKTGKRLGFRFQGDHEEIT